MDSELDPFEFQPYQEKYKIQTICRKDDKDREADEKKEKLKILEN